jgi:hypothetical protein
MILADRRPFGHGDGYGPDGHGEGRGSNLNH